MRVTIINAPCIIIFKVVFQVFMCEGGILLCLSNGCDQSIASALRAVLTPAAPSFCAPLAPQLTAFPA